MTTKEDLVKFFQTVSARPAIPRSGFEEKLRDFVDAIKEGIPDLDGAVRRSDLSAYLWNVVLWPKFRPDQPAIMLTLSQQSGRGIVHASEQHSFDTPNELWTYLVQFSNLPAFQTSLLELRERNREPAPGLLRTESMKDVKPDDVVLEVAPDTVRAIHDRASDTFSVELVTPPPMGVFTSALEYRFLTVAGFAVAVKSVKEVGVDVLEVTGEVVPT